MSLKAAVAAGVMALGTFLGARHGKFLLHNHNRKKNYNSDDLYSILSLTTDIFKAKGLRYWIDCGTLLGAVRDRNIIAWDYDIDLCAFAVDEEKIRKALNEYLTKVAKTSNPQVKGVYPPFKLLIGHHFDRVIMINSQTGEEGAYIDLNYYQIRKAGNTKISSRSEDQVIAADPFRTLTGMAFTYSVAEVFPLKEYPIREKSFWGPGQPESILKRLYGDYMTPVEKKM